MLDKIRIKIALKIVPKQYRKEFINAITINPLMASLINQMYTKLFDRMLGGKKWLFLLVCTITITS